MKIVKVLHIIDSAGMYGAEVMLMNLILQHIKKGIKASIVSIGNKKDIEKPIETEALKNKIYVKKIRMLPGPNLLGAFDILRFAKQYKYNILHSHGYKGNILFGALPKIARRLPIVSTVHGYTSVDSGFTKIRLYEWLDTRILNRVDQVVIVNKGMIGHPKLRPVNKKKINVIDNGISEKFAIDKFSLDNSIINFCDHPFVIGAIGRLSKEKGFNLLIRAVCRIINEGFDTKLVIIGEGRCRQELENLVQTLGLKNKVLIKGYINNAARYIPLFNVLAMPSLTEGLPITLLEAMRAGVPVVASRVGGIPNVIVNNHSGLLINPNDPVDLAEKIKRLHIDKTFRKYIANNSRKRFLQKYTSDRMATMYLSIYQKVLNSVNE